MLVTLAVVGGAATAVALAVLLVAGHRWRRGGPVRALALAVPATLAVGEVVARAWRLPSDQVLVAEAALVVVAAGVALGRRDWNPVGVWFLACLLVAEAGYLACAAEVTVAGGLAPAAAVVSGLLWLLEAAGLLLAASFAFETCDVVCRTRWRRPVEPPDTARPHRPFVSVHVAAYDEPPDMLIETIRSLERLHHPDLEIVVVDNNTEDADVWKPVEEYCAGRSSVRFVHVDPWPGYKAGALNLALAELTDPRAEVIAVVDADYLVDPEWLDDLLGWFADPRVAFVQSPQDYDDWAGDTYLTACHDSYAYFFTASMRSRHERNSAIFGGTMGLIRRSALVEVGGWDERCITEDAEVSLRLYAAGYDGVYVHRSYGRGLMPLTFDALKRQRYRWCFGGMQILRRHARLLLPGRRGPDDHLSAAQRLDFLVGGLQWATDLVALGYVLVLAASVATVLDGGHVGFRPLGGAAVILPLAFALAGTVRAVWALRVLQGISVRRAVLAFATWAALSLTVARAVARGIVRRDGVFLRTPKWHPDGGIVEAVRATRAETALAAGLAGAAAVAGLHGQPVLAALAAGQAALYAAAPGMAWSNLRTELTARRERRRQAEERRADLSAFEARMARAAVATLALGCAGLVALVANLPTDADPLDVPQRGADDAGPLGNIGLAPGAGPESPTPPTTAATAPPSAPAALTTDGRAPGADGETSPDEAADGTDPGAGDVATPTTGPPPTPAPTTAPSAATPTTSRPGNGNGNGVGPDPTRPTGPPTSNPGGR